MEFTTKTRASMGRTLAAVALAATMATFGDGTVSADSGDGSSKSLVGVWSVQVTLRNCATNAPMGPPFYSLVTFHEGGTLSEAAGGTTFGPGQRSAGHGVWTDEREHTFAQRMVALILRDSAANLPGTPGFDPSQPVSPGFLAGWQTVTHTVTPIDADHITSAGTNEFYDLSGNSYRTGCSTAVGERFE